MKKLLYMTVATVALLFWGCGGAHEMAAPADEEAAVAQPPAGRGKASATFAGQEVSIDYGRPQLQGRDMLNQLAAGQVWRFGKDQSTTFTAGVDLKFGETTIPKGSYSLFLKKVDADTWHLVVNKQTGQWGTQHDTSQDLTEIPLTPSQSDEKVEVFTIELEGSGSSGTLTTKWDTLVLSADFEAATS